MPVWTRKVSVSTKQPTGLKGILPLIRLDFPFLHTVPLPMSLMIGDSLRCCQTTSTIFGQNLSIFRRLPSCSSHGYHLDYLTQELERIYPQIMTKIRFERSTKPSKQEKAAQGKSGFVPAVARWVIERSNAWMEHCKILVKNGEANLSQCHNQNQPLLHQVND